MNKDPSPEPTHLPVVMYRKRVYCVSRVGSHRANLYWSSWFEFGTERMVIIVMVWGAWTLPRAS